MKVLIISNSEWRDDNSFGNTFSSIFGSIKDIEFANIYCREGKPNTSTCNKFLKISNETLIKHFLKRKFDPAVFEDKQEENVVEKNNAKSFARKKRWAIFFILRELIWTFSSYKKKNFFTFIEDFNPDLILLPISFGYINKMALYLNKKYNLPIISYTSDDNYSLRRITLSPFFWINRLYQRKWVLKALRKSSKVYVISNIQKQELERDTKIVSTVITKSYNFNGDIPSYSINKPIHLIYAGNLGDGRCETLALISKAIKEVNELQEKFVLDVYSSTSLSDKQIQLLNNEGTKLNGAIPYKELIEKQKSADILVHVEGLKKKNILQVKQSFSTKLVDYFIMAKCILAVGNDSVASLNYLKVNDAGIICSSTKEIIDVLEKISNDNSLIGEFGKKAYICGQKFHNKQVQDKIIEQDFNEVLKK